MRLCIDVGSEFVKCAIFDGQKIARIFRVKEVHEIKKGIEGATIDQGLLICNNLVKGKHWANEISSWKIPIQPLVSENFASRATPDVQDLLLPDTIAKIYGALTLYPMSDCLVVDFGTTVRYELISKEGRLLGRTTFPFFDILSEAMSIEPLVLTEQIPPPLGHNLVESMNSGCYYGLLGSVERIIAEIRQLSPNMITIATGTLTENINWQNPSSELVDHIHPYLVLEGLNQIINEGK